MRGKQAAVHRQAHHTAVNMPADDQVRAPVHINLKEFRRMGKQYGKRLRIRLSQQGRLLLHAGVLALAFTVKCFNPWAVMIMLLIPQIPIRLYPLTHREQKNDAAGGETLE